MTVEWKSERSTKKYDLALTGGLSPHDLENGSCGSSHVSQFSSVKSNLALLESRTIEVKSLLLFGIYHLVSLTQRTLFSLSDPLPGWLYTSLQNA
jgi:hypothetical protein